MAGPQFEYRTRSQEVLDRQRGIERHAHPLTSFTIFGNIDAPQAELAKISEFHASLIPHMAVAGEPIYHRTRCLHYLHVARVLTSKLSQLENHSATLFIWAGRAAFLHQRSLRGSQHALTPSLTKLFARDVAAVLKQVGILPPDFDLLTTEFEGEASTAMTQDIAEHVDDSSDVDVWKIERVELRPIHRVLAGDGALTSLEKCELVMELGVRLAYLERPRPFERCSKIANELAGFEFELTGVQGIRRKYQQVAYAQLAVRRLNTAEGKDGESKTTGNNSGIVISETDSKIQESRDGVVYTRDKATGEIIIHETPGMKEERERAERKQKRMRDLKMTEEEEVKEEEAYIARKVLEGAQVSGQVKLDQVDDMNDLMEKMVILGTEEERVGLEEELTLHEQILLLMHCEAHCSRAENAKDEILLEQMAALVNRTLIREDRTPDRSKQKSADDPQKERKLVQKMVDDLLVVSEEINESSDAEDDPTARMDNWLVYSAGLYFRCKTERYRTKTKDRAAMQLSVLIEQFNDESPSSAHRLRFSWCVNYPTQWELQREVGMRMMELGAVLSACNHFKTLELYEEAVECLMVSGRRSEAKELAEQQLNSSPEAKQVHPILLCLLGDLTGELKHYDEAWEFSNKRCARAKRSLAKIYFNQGKLEEAIEAYDDSLKVNPMIAGAWFTKGICELRLRRYPEAGASFARVVALDDEDADAWGNCVAVALSMDDWEKAWRLSEQACRRGREKWRFWTTRLTICMTLLDINGALEAIKVLGSLKMANHIDRRFINGVVRVVTDNMRVSSRRREPIMGDTLGPNVLTTFIEIANKPGGSGVTNTITEGNRNTTTMAVLWNAIGRLQEHLMPEALEAAAESREKEGRALKATIGSDDRIAIGADGQMKELEKLELYKQLADCYSAQKSLLDKLAESKESVRPVYPKLLNSLVQEVLNSKRRLPQPNSEEEKRWSPEQNDTIESVHALFQQIIDAKEELAIPEEDEEEDEDHS